MSFFTLTNAELLYSLAQPVTKNTYTTEAVMSAVSTQARAKVPAAFWGGPGKSLYAHAAGTIANTGAATFQMRVGWDPTPGTFGTSLGTPWPTLAPTAATTCLWELDLWITNQIVSVTASGVGGAGLNLQTNGKLVMSVVASGTLSTAPQTVMFQNANATLNSEADAYIELWGTWGASSASNTTTLQQFDLFGLN